ncbi:SymE family type I addiction module toxin [Larkinella soli]|uniref:SymE family type I addiction module toxin n=1 Tax=Larkinella soli TaxID=1770527 RepID=UPI000FFC8A72|nr:SymE family type I addiction module toxin [Larkinella soli]
MKKKILKTGRRQLKVYEKSQPRSAFRYVVLPEIRLCGQWLRETGFECGQAVQVHHEPHRITITVQPGPEPESR